MNGIWSAFPNKSLHRENSIVRRTILYFPDFAQEIKGLKKENAILIVVLNQFKRNFEVWNCYHCHLNPMAILSPYYIEDISSTNLRPYQTCQTVRNKTTHYMKNSTCLYFMEGEKDECIIKTEHIRMFFDFMRITATQRLSYNGTTRSVRFFFNIQSE